MKVHFFSISIRFSLFLFCLLFLSSLSNNLLFAQTEETDNQDTIKIEKTKKVKKIKVKKSTHFWGITPHYGKEPYYIKGEFDINILPIVYQTSFSKRVDFRINSVVNLGFREYLNEFSHIGFEMAIPIFIIKKEERFLPSKGFFVAPVFSLTTNTFDKTNRGFWAEAGYNLQLNKRLGLSLGFQYGKTQFIYKDSENEVTNHYGLKIIFGKWY